VYIDVSEVRRSSAWWQDSVNDDMNSADRVELTTYQLCVDIY